jgi:predicted transcriptional regulator of viral defense system
MKQAIFEKIKTIFFANKGYATTGELSEIGINRFYISELRKNGIVEQVKAGFYKWRDYDFDYDFELVEVFRIIPSGVLCLKSALAYHGLTTYNPWQYEVAIERSGKVGLPPYPPIKVVFFSKSLHELGVMEVDIESHQVKVYDLEKTICDCIRYRNKIGIEMVKEGLNTYLKRSDRNLEKLLVYAEKCKTRKLVNEYLEVLV